MKRADLLDLEPAADQLRLSRACRSRSSTDCVIGGLRDAEVDLAWRRPASRSRTSWRLVVPRTIESSTTTTLRSLRISPTGLNFTRTASTRDCCPGRMKVRPT